MKKVFTIFSLLFLAILIMAPNAVLAQESDNVFVTQDRVVEYNYFKAGNTVDVSGTLQKDAYLVGNTVNIDGIIEGDLIGAANVLILNGEVKGNVRFAASQIIINGIVGKNLMVVGNTVNISPNANIGWEALAAGNIIQSSGQIGGNVNFAGAKVEVDGQVAGRLFANVEGGQLELGPNANIGYGIEYICEKDLYQNESATVIGEVEKVSPAYNQQNTQRQSLLAAKVSSFFWALLSALVVMCFMLLLMPKHVKNVGDYIVKNWAMSFGVGLLFLFVTPIALIILMITVIGIPLAMIIFAVYLILIYIAKIYFAYALSDWAMDIFKMEKKKANLWLMTFLGLLVLVVLCHLPYVGWIFGLVSAASGFGAFFFIKKQELKK